MSRFLCDKCNGNNLIYPLDILLKEHSFANYLMKKRNHRLHRFHRLIKSVKSRYNYKHHLNTLIGIQLC